MAESTPTTESLELQGYRDMILNSQSQPSENTTTDTPSTSTPLKPTQDPSQIQTSPINLSYSISQISLAKTQLDTQPAVSESQTDTQDLLAEVSAAPSHHLFDETARFGPDSPVPPVTPAQRRFPQLKAEGVPSASQLWGMSSPQRPVGESPAFKGSLPTPLRKLQEEEATSASPRRKATTSRKTPKQTPAKYVTLEESQEKRNRKTPTKEVEDSAFESEDDIVKTYRRKQNRRRQDEEVEEELRSVKIPPARKPRRRGRSLTPAEEEVPERERNRTPTPIAPVAKMVMSQAQPPLDDTIPDTDDEKDLPEKTQVAESDAEPEKTEVADSDADDEDWGKISSSIPLIQQRRRSAVTEDGLPATIADSQPGTQVETFKRPALQRSGTSEIPVDGEGEVLLRGSPDAEERVGGPLPMSTQTVGTERVAETSPAGTAAPRVEQEEEEEEERHSNTSTGAKKRKRGDKDTTASPKRKKHNSAALQSSVNNNEEEQVVPCSDEEENAERNRKDDHMDLDHPPTSSANKPPHPPTPTPHSKAARLAAQKPPPPIETSTEPESHGAEESQNYKMLTSPTTKRTPRVYGSNAKSGIGSKSTIRKKPQRTPAPPAAPSTVPLNRSTRSTTSLRHSITTSGLFDKEKSSASASLFSPQSEISSFSTPLPNRQPSLPYLNISTTESASTVHCPNRVWALFKNVQGYHYPATYDPARKSVIFDDGTVVADDGTLTLRNLALREGDRVKLTGLASVTWDVLKVEEAPERVETGDVEGNEYVLLKRHRGRRRSVTATTDDAAADDEEIRKVKIRDLYLPRSLVKQFPAFLARVPSSPLRSGPVTRSETGSTPLPTTPTKPRPGRAPILSSPSTSRRTDGPIFGGHLIAITLGPQDRLKGALTKSILDNGGAVIDSSLETLFTLPPLTPGTTISNPTLHLSPDEKEAANKQVVVVADKYCRREKFLQALALGLPVVHVRWVQDCAAHHKLLSWAAYQLPSGESAFLDGTVISRAHQPGLEGSLETMVERRPRLLSGKRMVFVVGAGGVKRKTFWFLVNALGLAAITVVGTVEDARRKVEGEEGEGAWEYVYVDWPSGPGGHAEKPTVRKATTLRGKRSKGQLKGDGGGKGEKVGEWKVGDVVRGARVVDDEWIVQSLILGRGLDCY